MRLLKSLAITCLLLATAVHAASPPEVINYQGVLRDAADNPLNGDYDMVFRLWSAELGGDEILLDRHLAVNLQAVAVTGGLFNVMLGAGEVLDGLGQGTYASLAGPFRDYGELWLEVQIGSETLSPRVRVAASGYALNSSHLSGRAAAEFLDTSSAEQVKPGKLIVGAPTGTGSAYGIEAYGTMGGGYFEDVNNSGYAEVGHDVYGIRAYGNAMGGYFKDRDDSGYAWVGRSDTGIEGYGDFAGGFFQDLNNSGHAWVAIEGYGIQGHGTNMGGLFKDHDDSGYAWVGRSDTGIEGYGNFAGGFFRDLDSRGYAYVGLGDFGIDARGEYQAFRVGGGGRFEDTLYTGVAYVAHGNQGIYAEGSDAGGVFEDTDSGNYGRVAFSSYKIWGTGSVSFVQNHPEDESKVVVYHAPEASEVAVYTRGSARLDNGVARVVLDETFQWTANPDLGLTAHLTPRDHVASPLVAESVSTTELVVYGPDGSDASFDYLVYGLRIGFEESSVVQPKEREAYLPSIRITRTISWPSRRCGSSRRKRGSSKSKRAYAEGQLRSRPAPRSWRPGSDGSIPRFISMSIRATTLPPPTPPGSRRTAPNSMRLPPHQPRLESIRVS